MAHQRSELTKRCRAEFPLVPGNFWMKADTKGMVQLLALGNSEDEEVFHARLYSCLPLLSSMMQFCDFHHIKGLRFTKGSTMFRLAVLKGQSVVMLPLVKIPGMNNHVVIDMALGQKAWNEAPEVVAKKKKKVVAAITEVDPANLTPLQQVRHALNSRYIEREYETMLLQVSAVSRAHLFFLGPPGTGKTEMIQDFAKCVSGDVFDTLLSGGTSRDEIEGPIDVSLLRQEGEQRRRRKGYLTEATYGVLDEIWKSSPFLLNGLLRLMSQRSYFEEGEEYAAKTRCVFAASNETPQDSSLEALYSRFTLRSYTDYIVTDDGRSRLCGFTKWDRQEIPAHLLGVLSEEDLEAERQKALALPLSKGFCAAMQKVLKALSQVVTGPRSRGIKIDDRRLRLLTEVAQVWAHLDGQEQVGAEYVLILADTAWDGVAERGIVESIVYGRGDVSKVVSAALASGDEVLNFAIAELIRGHEEGGIDGAGQKWVPESPMGAIEALVVDRIKKGVLKSVKAAD